MIEQTEPEVSPLTYCLTTSRWIRLTYLFTDEQVDKLDHGIVVLSCHKCGNAELYYFTPPPPAGQETYGEEGDPAARKMRDTYEQMHQHR